MQTVDSFADRFERHNGLVPIATGLFNPKGSVKDALAYNESVRNWLDDPTYEPPKKPVPSKTETHTSRKTGLVDAMYEHIPATTVTTNGTGYSYRVEFVNSGNLVSLDKPRPKSLVLKQAVGRKFR